MEGSGSFEDCSTLRIAPKPFMALSSELEVLELGCTLYCGATVVCLGTTPVDPVAAAAISHST